MTLRQPLFSALLALGLLAGCSSRSTPDARPAESGGTPTAQAPMDTPPADKPVATAPAESGGTAAPAPRGPAVYFVRDSGVRCMAAPCPSFIATRADKPDEEGLKITDVDMAALGLSDEKRNAIMEGTHFNPGIKVEATVETVPNAGPAGAATVLRVSKVVEGK